MSDSSTSSSGLGPTGIAFGLGMALLGLVLGYMIGSSQGGGSSEADIAAQVDKAVEARLAKAGDANKVVNNTGGELRKLSDAEKKELLAKKDRAAPPAPAAPANSPFLTEAIVKSFEDDAALTQYREAVALMAQGNARKARPALTALHARSEGKPWAEQVTVLLADARISVGEVDAGRELLTAWRDAHPMSAHAATATVAEGKAAMKDGKRIADGPGDELPAAKQRAYDDAISLFDKAIKGWPEDPALEQAYLNKAALLGEMGRMDEAEAAANALADAFPTAKQAPRALFNVARAAFNEEDFPRAERIYQRLVTDFPKDRLSKSARSNLSALKLLGKPAPELDLSEWVGDEIAMTKGKPTLLVFWATWCPHCRKAMPGIENDIWQKYKDQGLNVIAVTKNSRGQTTDKVKEYLAENGYTVPVAIDPGTTSRNYGVSGIPAAALVDKDGKVVFRNHPAQVTDELIQKYL